MFSSTLLLHSFPLAELPNLAKGAVKHSMRIKASLYCVAMSWMRYIFLENVAWSLKKGIKVRSA